MTEAQIMAVEIGARWPGEYKLGTTPMHPIPQSFFVKGLPDGVHITVHYARGEWRFSNQGLGIKPAATRSTSCPVFASGGEVQDGIRDFLRRCLYASARKS
jgi:hypothetical protein